MLITCQGRWWFSHNMPFNLPNKAKRERLLVSLFHKWVNWVIKIVELIDHFYIGSKLYSWNLNPGYLNSEPACLTIIPLYLQCQIIACSPKGPQKLIVECAVNDHYARRFSVHIIHKASKPFPFLVVYNVKRNLWDICPKWNGCRGGRKLVALK